MKNAYEIRGDVTAIFLKYKKTGVLETIIDTADLPKVMEIRGTLYALWSEDPKTFYAVFMLPRPNRRMERLHRYLLDAPEHLDVDHLHHEGLDNRRLELRLVTHAQNQMNRRGAQRNSVSGVRGVYWHRQCSKWNAKVKVNGHSFHLGLFNDKRAAEAAANAFRAKNGDLNARTV